MIYFLLFMMGASIGSFFNVVLSRPDWYKGRSHCDTCGYTLKWYDLIPIFSYLFLRGRCRKCKTKIKPTHLISEIMMGCTFVCASFCFSLYGVNAALLYSTGFFFLCLAAMEDIKEKCVYSWILYGGIIAVAGLKAYICMSGGLWYDALFTLLALLIFNAISVLASKFASDKIGAGDFDILMIMIIMLGPYDAILALTAACLIGTIIFLPPILMKKRDRKESLPLVPFLYLGTLLITLSGGIL